MFITTLVESIHTDAELIYFHMVEFPTMAIFKSKIFSKEYLILSYEQKNLSGGCSHFIAYSQNPVKIWAHLVGDFVHAPLQRHYRELIDQMAYVWLAIDVAYDKWFPLELIQLLLQCYLNASLYRRVNSYVQAIRI